MKNNSKLIATFLLIVSFVTTSFADSPGMQTITLNTGFNHVINSRYTRPTPFNYPLAASVNHKDSYWTLIHDPKTNGGTPIPRMADIMPRNPAWAVEMPNSEWLAFERNGNPGAGSGAFTYVFEKCFCLKKGFDQDKEAYEKTKLDIQLRADDWAAVYLNQPLATILAPTIPPPPYTALANGTVAEPNAILKISSSAGGYNSPNAASMSLNADRLMRQLRVGRNCIQVKLYDLGRVVSGFNLTGSITALGIDEVAQFNPRNPRQQFSACSSCSNPKVVQDDRVFDTAGDRIREPQVTRVP